MHTAPGCLVISRLNISFFGPRIVASNTEMTLPENRSSSSIGSNVLIEVPPLLKLISHRRFSNF